MNRDRFWSKVNKTEIGCWNWTANKNNKGYGMFSMGTVIGKKLAHRISYEIANGRIPDGMVIMHSCDNPACVNPSHLSAGTYKDNMIDCAKKGRSGGFKISDASVISLLKDYVKGMSHKDIAKKYGISVKTVPDFTGGESRQWLLGNHGCPSLEELKAARNMKPNAKVSEETAREIREKLNNGSRGIDLAAEYGLHKATISDIKLFKIWK